MRAKATRYQPTKEDNAIYFQPKTKEEVIEAVEFFCQKIKEGRVKEGYKRYGNFNKWDTSLISYKDMQELLKHRSKFDESDSEFDFDKQYVTNVMTLICGLIGR